MMVDRITKYILVGVISLVTPFNALAQDLLKDITTLEAYEKGKLLYFQHKVSQARPYLAIASQEYPLAARIFAVITPDKKTEYMELAAQMGDTAAMNSLASFSSSLPQKQKEYWKRKSFEEINYQISENNSPRHMYQKAFLSSIDKPLGVIDDYDLDLLVKASDLGYPKAIYALAKNYESGDGWFFSPSKRRDKVEELYKQAAEAGYPPAIATYAYVLADKPEHREEALDWMLKGAEIGKAQSLTFLAGIYSRNDEMRDVVPHDSVKAAGYYKAYFAVMGDESDKELYDIHWNIFNNLLKTMTSEEKKKADKFANDYLATHTVRAFDDFWEWGVDYGERPD